MLSCASARRHLVVVATPTEAAAARATVPFNMSRRLSSVDVMACSSLFGLLVLTPAGRQLRTHESKRLHTPHRTCGRPCFPSDTADTARRILLSAREAKAGNSLAAAILVHVRRMVNYGSEADLSQREMHRWDEVYDRRDRRAQEIGRHPDEPLAVLAHQRGSGVTRQLTWSTDPSTLPVNIGQAFGGYQEGATP